MASQPHYQLGYGSRIAVVGGDPADSFFSYFLLGMAERVGIDILVDIYEPKDFNRPGAGGCNHCGVTRFCRDGIGSDYRAAKAAATTAVLQGISAADLRESYRPVCQALNTGNGIAKFIFAFARHFHKRDFTRRVVVRRVSRGQGQNGGQRLMSTMMWDMYTGGAPYREILLHGLYPGLWVPLLGDCADSLINRQ